ncbi:tyrosine-type recombinase/integrase [Paracoccus onubensis]|uniref:Recombinase n=1 Tax=Paracoccus onubensis TaxID=1675788 RepID=A0A418T451_9RHOB|nr:tyrosine-type recombinase/integrase [Paracoccus onubensis]RJE87992.1 recombinase [Paracoccus onubensis]
MRRRVRGLTGIKIVRKADGRRYVYRRVNGNLMPLPDLPEHHPDFIAAYVAAGNLTPKLRHPAGSISALCEAYLGSHDYKRMADSTRATWRRTLDRIGRDRGAGLVKDLRQDHLRKDIRALSPGAAQNRLKAWRSILKFAVEEGWIEVDPSIGIKAQKGEVTPHRQWTAKEIETYRTYWKARSPERIAFEVIYWTGARCVDAVTLGWQKVDRDGWLSYVQAKTAGPATCPVWSLPDWAASMSADHKHFLQALPEGQMIWIATRTGKPRSVKGLSQWLSAAASTAGLADDCTAHGLRKARAASLAEAGATASQIGAWTGHASLSEVSHYTRQADQKGILGAKKEQTLETKIKKFPKTPD